MAIFGDQSSVSTARAAVEAALNSKSVQLLGPSSIGHAEENAKADAKYLAALIKELVIELRK